MDLDFLALEKDENLKKARLADKINQLPSLEITLPESDYDYHIYSTYVNRESGWRQKTIDWALSVLPSSVITPDGEVFFTRSSLRNALAHGKGKLKLLSIPFIPKMLQNGVLFHVEKRNGFCYFNYAHPLNFEKEKHYGIIVIREDHNGKRFYDNEFVTKIKMADGLDYSQGLPATRQKTCAHPSAGSILRDILNVKLFTTSL